MTMINIFFFMKFSSVCACMILRKHENIALVFAYIPFYITVVPFLTLCRRALCAKISYP